MTDLHRRDFLRVSAAALAVLALPALPAVMPVANGAGELLGFCQRPGDLYGYVVGRSHGTWWLLHNDTGPDAGTDLRDDEVCTRKEVGWWDGEPDGYLLATEAFDWE